MKDFNKETALQVMDERFGHDNLIALATAEDGLPSVRAVNSFYEDGSFYVITHAASGKMRAIGLDPRVGICGDWFTGHGLGESMGHILSKGNEELAGKLRTAFAQWYDNGHTNEEDVNTVFLRIRMTDGILLHHGMKYDIDFT